MSNSGELLADLVAELERLLEEERAILLSGRPARLAGVAGRKLTLAEAIERARDTTQMAACREAVLRLATYNHGNSVICSALLRELRRTMDALRRRELHRSYRADGAERSPATQNRLGAA